MDTREQKLKEEAIWPNSLSQEAVEPSLSGSPHCCEYCTSLGNCVIEKWGKAMLRKETRAMRVIQLPTSVWRFEINGLKRQKGIWAPVFTPNFIELNCFRPLARQNTLRHAKKKMKLLIALWLRIKKKRESLGSKTHILPSGMPLMTYFIQLDPAS